MGDFFSCLRVVGYWDAVERFSPYRLDTRNKLSGSTQREVFGAEDVPWNNQKIELDTTQVSGEMRVHNVFMGIISYHDIAKLIKESLQDGVKEYNPPSRDQLSCLCTFQLSDNGEVFGDTFAVPEYFISITCLRQKGSNPTLWLNSAPQIRQKFQDVFQNWLSSITNRTERTISFQDLETLLTNIIRASNVTALYDCVRNNFVVNTYKYKNIPKQHEEGTEGIKTSDLNMLNSFYLDDIAMVRRALETNNFGKGLASYLNQTQSSKKYDLRADSSLLQKLSQPELLPPSRWPGTSDVTLSLAQRIAVNIAVQDTPGIFSVNGPPGTGKSTLLRDIISEVITTRAKLLATFVNPKDAFTSSTIVQIGRYTYKAWSLDPRLLNHQIVIASSNNAAVENISKEMPRLSEVDPSYCLEYFPEIATHINGEDCWGIGAAVLGNRSNCSAFFEKFWAKRPTTTQDGRIDNSYGLEYLLNNMCTYSNWSDVRQSFVVALGRFSDLRDELISLRKKVCRSYILDALHSRFTNRINDTLKEIDVHNSQLKEHQDEAIVLNGKIDDNTTALKLSKELMPRWYILLLGLLFGFLFYIFKKESPYQQWFKTHKSIVQEISQLLKESQILKQKISQLEKLKADIQSKVRRLEAKLANITTKMEKNLDDINIIKGEHQWYSNIPDKEFWQRTDAEIQLSSPWAHKELEEVRAQVFVAAMNLHYSFIINTKEYISNNLKSMRQVLTGEWPQQSRALLQHVWSTFFIVVPSISTTFASLGKLFEGLKEPESIGWLLIDEAGQSAPQEALGAIYRARKTIVVGDPLQIPPVVTISEAINTTLLEYYHVEPTWSVLEESVQTVSDRVSTYGTYISQGSNSIWVGCPLRVHRRCIDPMFTLANQIAYDNLMIQGTFSKTSSDTIYPQSKWLDVQDQEFEGNWSRKEGDVVLDVIRALMEKCQNLPDLYIISPFKVVAYKMSMLLKEEPQELLSIISSGHSKHLLTKYYEWVRKSVGTVHTFQGKQAGVVILLLGGNPLNIGAIDWASRSPNILNVALTRAKYSFIIVGNYNIWSTKPYFKLIPNMLRPRSV